MATKQPPDVGEERVQDRKTRRSIKSILVNRRTWKIVIWVFSFGYKIYKIVAKGTEFFE